MPLELRLYTLILRLFLHFPKFSLIMSKDYTFCVIIVMSCQDQQYPYIETPSILCNLDNVVNSLFRKELRAKGPEMFKWRWLEGITTFP